MTALTDIESWKAYAACRDTETSTMFPAPGDPNAIRVALDVCKGCTVRFDCLRHAIDNDEAHGVWGGTTARQRFRIATRVRAGNPLELLVPRG